MKILLWSKPPLIAVEFAAFRSQGVGKEQQSLPRLGTGAISFVRFVVTDRKGLLAPKWRLR